MVRQTCLDLCLLNSSMLVFFISCCIRQARDERGGKKQDKNMHALLQAAQIKDKHQMEGIHNNIQTLSLWQKLFF